MINIKKVAVSPIPRNEASVIDSLNTNDDKTINAPSIRAVNEGLGSKANTNETYGKSEVDNLLTDYKLNGDFAVITGSITVAASQSNSIDINYPAGFTIDNSVLISCGMKVIENKGYNYVGSYVDTTSLFNNVYIKYVNLKSSNIYLYMENPNTDQSVTAQYKIVLMKVS